MCGRARLSCDVSEINLVFSIPPHRPTPNFPPSWNVAPTDQLPIVPFHARAGERSLDLARWGLVPYWAKDINVGFANINAKAEGIGNRPAFRGAFQWRRFLHRAAARRAAQPGSLCQTNLTMQWVPSPPILARRSGGISPLYCPRIMPLGVDLSVNAPPGRTPQHQGALRADGAFPPLSARGRDDAVLDNQRTRGDERTLITAMLALSD
jgi:hypothetical protein